MTDTLGSRIRTAREAKGLTQGQLARAVDAPDARTVWQWEVGRANPRGDVVARLAVALGCSTDHLLIGPTDAAPADAAT